MIVDDFLSKKYPDILKHELESFKIGLLDVADKALQSYLLELKRASTVYIKVRIIILMIGH